MTLYPRDNYKPLADGHNTRKFKQPKIYSQPMTFYRLLLSRKVSNSTAILQHNAILYEEEKYN